VIEYIRITTSIDRVRVEKFLVDTDCTQRHTLDMGMELMSREQGRKGEAATRRGGSRPLRARLPPLGTRSQEGGRLAARDRALDPPHAGGGSRWDVAVGERGRRLVTGRGNASSQVREGGVATGGGAYSATTRNLRTTSGAVSANKPTSPPERYLLSVACRNTPPSTRTRSRLPLASSR
jgi:hypothetical protein